MYNFEKMSHLIHDKKNNEVFKIIEDNFEKVEFINHLDNNDNLFKIAVINKNEECAEYLFKKYKDKIDMESKSSCGNNIMIIPLLQENEKMLQLLCKLGFNINAKDNNGDTLIMQAAKNERILSFSHLMVLGADLTAKNNNGETIYDLKSNYLIEDILKMKKDLHM